MANRNLLTDSPPHEVTAALVALGANLRTARVRRGLTIAEVAAKIGTGPRAVADAEKGKPATGAVVYMALLWALGLIDQIDAIADPADDSVGLARSLAADKRPYRRIGRELDDDF